MLAQIGITEAQAREHSIEGVTDLLDAIVTARRIDAGQSLQINALAAAAPQSQEMWSEAQDIASDLMGRRDDDEDIDPIAAMKAFQSDVSSVAGATSVGFQRVKVSV